ncbi:AAA family ATPase [Marinimicrobium sp. ARAG 43.8]|uniref:AAA family ATPase n=1 Tax=Marinimicrobium sp. ARAG 43.8 TaxID=3418719 RepID=UPI003CF46769
MQDAHDLKLMLDSKVPLVVIESHEETKAINLLQRVARETGRPLYHWSITDGLTQLGFGPQLQPKGRQMEEPDAVLEHIKQQNTPGIYTLCDFHPFLTDQPRTIRLLKDIALNQSRLPHTLVLLSHRLSLPEEVQRFSASFQLSLPSDERILAIIREEARAYAEQHGQKRIKTDNTTLRRLMTNLQGLSASDVRRLVRVAIWQDGAITEEDLPVVNQAKFALLDMNGVMSYEYETADFSQVAGLPNLKRWLQRRGEAFHSDDSGAGRPRGILLLGVQGGGKSLAAKAVAGTWNLPLLRLDVGALYNKYHGETERNLREALAMADAMSPCVLWLDEIEKGLAQGNSDDGTSRRLLGTLLTWMAERKKPVFFTATSNDISKLPPELIRKGRVDEIFFVDLPDADVRQHIVDIHLRKRNLDPVRFDTAAISSATEGFSGAEIEQAIVAALYSNDRDALNTDSILTEVANTSPLSVVMAEPLLQLRQWAAERTVPA